MAEVAYAEPHAPAPLGDGEPFAQELDRWPVRRTIALVFMTNLAAWSALIGGISLLF